ncbi:MAG: FecR domain-containing protein [Sphingomonadales bacterium]|nr:FecR domain-containing protein [Sphingomonadales bacterium]MDE2170878.1 FecR domain-containing protein [Sphingomonadales bacterium]
MTDPQQPGAHDGAIARFAAARGDDAIAPAPPTPEDAAAVQEISQVWRDLDAVAEHPAIRAMRAEALARLEAQGPVDAPSPPLWRMSMMAALAATVVVAVGLGLAEHTAPTLPAPDDGQMIANGQSLPRTVDLADGTRITLDSHTQLHVSRDGRLARLDYGRAFFSVHHDEAHPFAVKVADMVVSDIGTHFEIGQTGGTTTVTLVEGKVRVARGAVATDLVPGHRLTLSSGKLAMTALDAGRQTLWQAGMISADDVPVATIVASYNRYLSKPMVLKNPALGAMRISGEFRLDDPQGFLAAVTAMGRYGTERSGSDRGDAAAPT